jgi:hypothetical protein
MNFLYIGLSLYASDTSFMWVAYLNEMIANTRLFFLFTFATSLKTPHYSTLRPPIGHDILYVMSPTSTTTLKHSAIDRLSK